MQITYFNSVWVTNKTFNKNMKIKKKKIEAVRIIGMQKYCGTLALFLLIIISMATPRAVNAKM